ncbi:MAG: class I SAM-dependent rRNA methyltransferase [Chlamydiia bacterium]|nr:class I SAM-dependent rRNA methyltransferase [Chlamydiia bacterium]
MQTLSDLQLKRGKEKPILQGHHWIYSGAIHSFPEGPLSRVISSEGKTLGIAFLSKGHSIAAHMMAFGAETLEEAVVDRLCKAIALRRKWFDPLQTNAIRLINAEGDGFPGLIVDAYADVLVMQISHPGVESVKEQILNVLIKEMQPTSIYEKSTSFLRKKEGLQESRALLYGSSCAEVEVLENGLKFSVDVQQGQKTGLFLDQRDLRQQVRSLARGRRILNGFAYTGGFSIAALAGGAKAVDSVEISGKCLPRLAKNISLNGLTNHRFVEQDMVDFLREESLDYDLIILDPPAFVKKREDVARAFRAYKDMNCQALKKMPSGSLLLTCSCSYHIDEALFQNILFRAALEAGKRVRILGRHRQALDHPISLFHPESSYLKSFLLYVE